MRLEELYNRIWQVLMAIGMVGAIVGIIWICTSCGLFAVQCELVPCPVAPDTVAADTLR